MIATCYGIRHNELSSESQHHRIDPSYRREVVAFLLVPSTDRIREQSQAWYLGALGGIGERRLHVL